MRTVRKEKLQCMSNKANIVDCFEYGKHCNQKSDVRKEDRLSGLEN